MLEDAVAAAFRAACFAELQALKPGNVHIHAAGHRMDVSDFERSATAAAPFVAKSGASVGARVFEAIRAARAVVDDNVNLGIVLLCAPLAAAKERDRGKGLRESLKGVLAALDVQDADLAFQAISLAKPAGLGTRDDHDVRAPAHITLLEAMRLAADHDRIARAYATDFEDVFDLGLPALAAAEARTGPGPWATTALYLSFLTAFPDTHIARKYGLPAALAVMEKARAFTPPIRSDPRTRAALLAFDADLKAAGLNPGAHADLTVATLFAAALAKSKASA